MRPRAASLSTSTTSFKRRRVLGTASPTTVLDGLSVLSTDGSIPVDCGEGELEDQDISSFLNKDSKLAAETHRTREEDSDPSTSKRPRSERDAAPCTQEAPDVVSDPPPITPNLPVVPSEQPSTPRIGSTVWLHNFPNKVPLYVDTRIVHDPKAESKNLDPLANRRRYYYISFFTSAGIGARSIFRGKAECPSGRHSVKAGIILLKTLTKTRQHATIEWLRFASASSSTPVLLSSNAFTKVPEAWPARTVLQTLLASARGILPGTRLSNYPETLKSSVLNSYARDNILVLCLSAIFRETLRTADLSVQKAYVVEAAQTISEISVELSERVCLL
ncbi:hypothetical protein PHMEG_0009962 [Phytophthora megakarya]|uniref:Uncharacterized protein n=1 Tax=Phytophthora megakarya TaxID=4795 RepID=A0A225WEW4_9STRA|nr:hypothetical protein PHMEG_0009962 [Phytophthora megakarya]